MPSKIYLFICWFVYSFVCWFVIYLRRYVIFISGLVPLTEIISQGNYILRIDLEDWDGEKRFAKYRKFDIGSTDEKYKLTASVYSGDAGIIFERAVTRLTTYVSFVRYLRHSIKLI